MCGFLGYENSVSGIECVQLGNLLHHRGPDATGYYHDDYFSFVHNRLSIIDLSNTANQPFQFENLVLTYNGEIYNYQETRNKLIKKGYTFQTNSDTEVLIKAFHYWGIDSVNHFIGMFAFCIYNKEKKEAYLVRDRLGIKPLFYSLNNGLSFGSEQKVFNALGIHLTINTKGLYQYFRFGFTMDSTTIYNEVQKIPPGSYLKYSSKDKVAERVKYWTIPIQQSETTVTASEITEKLEALLMDSFQYRLVSDVPVGVLLSGGIDSSLLAAILQKNSSNKLKTFTIGFDDANFDESKYARQVATHLGTEHHELILSKDKAHDLFNNFYDMYDEPFADTSGIPTAMVTQLAKENNVKVILSADGGDEFFGGYNHYRDTRNLYQRIKFINAILPKTCRDILKRKTTKYISNHVYNLEHKSQKFFELLNAYNNNQFIEASFANQTKEEIQRLIPYIQEESTISNFNNGQLVNDMLKWDAEFYLPDDLLTKIDRATMHHGIEARDPFLDHRLVEFSKTIPIGMNINNSTGKIMLRNILKKYIPAHLFERPKKGFSIPIYKWFNNNLDDMFRMYLDKNTITEIGILNWKEIDKEIKLYEHCKKSGKQYNIEKMWRILGFVMWHKKWIKAN